MTPQATTDKKTEQEILQKLPKTQLEERWTQACRRETDTRLLVNNLKKKVGARVEDIRSAVQNQPLTDDKQALVCDLAIALDADQTELDEARNQHTKAKSNLDAILEVRGGINA